MKKLGMLVVIALLIMITGCKKEEYITCNININNVKDGYTVNGTYKIYYNSNYVTKIKKDETYAGVEQSIFNFIKEKLELEYYDLKDKYGGVDYTIDVKGNKIVIDSIIDLKDFNISRMSKDGKIDSNYVIGNNLTKNGIKLYYESKGAICK